MRELAARRKLLSCMAGLEVAADLGFDTTSQPQSLGVVGALSRIEGLSTIPLIGRRPSVVMFGDRIPVSTLGERAEPVRSLHVEDTINPPPTKPPENPPATLAQPVTLTIEQTGATEPIRLLAAASRLPDREASSPEAAGLDLNDHRAQDGLGRSSLRPLADPAARQRLDQRGRIEALLNRIATERIPIEMSSGKHVLSRLPRSDQDLLTNPPFQAFVEKRLTGIADRQVKERCRLVAWITEHGAVPGSEPSDPKALRTLFTHWGDHLEARGAIEAVSLAELASRPPDQEPVPSVPSRADIVSRLEQVDFLPLRPQASALEDDGCGLLVLVTDKAVTEDAALIKQAVAIQEDVEVQAVLQRKFASFLERTRLAVTTSRKEKPAGGPIGWVAENDPRLLAALKAAKGSEPLKAVIAEAQTYLAGHTDGPDIVGFAHATRGRGGR